MSKALGEQKPGEEGDRPTSCSAAADDAAAVMHGERAAGPPAQTRCCRRSAYTHRLTDGAVRFLLYSEQRRALCSMTLALHQQRLKWLGNNGS
ncbi:unnamed protein product [Heligmosomoides polygyrus]|uniref:Uncharacterized protein n=1 Tax=Heligmosomoides polygyrus TaxID=6339 RepID=A0A183FEH6_HELPZ|nr:unnamed protein product [Heligmosomoides polygyrus]